MQSVRNGNDKSFSIMFPNYQWHMSRGRKDVPDRRTGYQTHTKHQTRRSPCVANLGGASSDEAFFLFLKTFFRFFKGDLEENAHGRCQAVVLNDHGLHFAAEGYENDLVPVNGNIRTKF